MFYSESLLLSKKGPLAKVWLAAHWERKLTKVQLLGTDITQSVGAIISPGPTMPLALRLSGQLLLGVVRIYSRKSKYLLDDCNEALMRLRMMFKPGHVDLSTEDLTTSKAAITLTHDVFQNNLDMDLLDINFDTASLADMPIYQPKGRPDANLLPGANLSEIDMLAGFGDGDLTSIRDHAYNGAEPEVELDSNGDIVPRRTRAASIGSIFSVEVGRAAPPPRPLGEELQGLYEPGSDDVEQGRRQVSAGPGFDDFGGFDFGNDDPIDPIDGQGRPSLPFQFDLGRIDGNSRLTPPPFGGMLKPDTPQSLTHSAIIALTPNTRDRIQKRRANDARDLGKTAMLNAARKSAKKMKFTVDVVTELEGRPNKRANESTGQDGDGAIEGYLLGRSGNFIPADINALRQNYVQEQMRGFELKNLVQKQKESIILATPSFGLPPYMENLWTKTIKTSHKGREPVARSPAMEEAMPDFGGDFPDFDDMPDPVYRGSEGGFFDTTAREVRAGSVGAASLNGSRAGSGSLRGRGRSASVVEYNEVGNEAEDVLAVFRKSHVNRETSQLGGNPSSAFNPKTVRAAEILEEEFSKSDDGRIEFLEMTKNSTRQGASTMFFQLLVLTAQRGIKVEQKSSFGEIFIEKGERLDSIVGRGIEAGR